jgi:ferredoxin
MKVTVDEEECIGCGVCVSVCPDVFELNDDGKAIVIAGADCEAAGCCEDAASQCAVEAIKIE